MKEETVFPDIKNEFMGKAGYRRHLEGGLTKRELFAAMAMQGLAASDVIQSWMRENYEKTGYDGTKHLVISSVNIADALIKELKAKEEGK